MIKYYEILIIKIIRYNFNPKLLLNRLKRKEDTYEIFWAVLIFASQLVLADHPGLDTSQPILPELPKSTKKMR